jgi:hypothetical protein
MQILVNYGYKNTKYLINYDTFINKLIGYVSTNGQNVSFWKHNADINNAFKYITAILIVSSKYHNINKMNIKTIPHCTKSNSKIVVTELTLIHLTHP